MLKRNSPDSMSGDDCGSPTKKYAAACYCPITQSLMKDPVQDKEGNSFERSAIEAWLRTNPTSPITRTPMTLHDLTPNRVLAAITNNMPGESMLEVLGESIQEPLVKYSAEVLLDVLANVDVSFENHTPDDKVDVVVSCKPLERRKKTQMLMVVDVSGSMSTEAKKNTGLSILDIVKHAARMTTAYMDEKDCLGLVEFSCTARVCMPMAPMTVYNKKKAEDAINGMRTMGLTNLWHGINIALKEFRDSDFDKDTVREMFIFTDGVPTEQTNPIGYVMCLYERAISVTTSACDTVCVEIYSGIVAALAREFDKMRELGFTPPSIHVFGFGNTLGKCCVSARFLY